MTKRLNIIVFGLIGLIFGILYAIYFMTEGKSYPGFDQVTFGIFTVNIPSYYEPIILFASSFLAKISCIRKFMEKYVFHWFVHIILLAIALISPLFMGQSLIRALIYFLAGILVPWLMISFAVRKR